eukprot:3948656-Ditylum_brightwellii.AAC.1
MYFSNIRHETAKNNRTLEHTLYNTTTTAISVNVQPAQLGVTLQVYFHLDEFPQIAWGAVESAMELTECAIGQFFNSSAVQHLMDGAVLEDKISAENEASLSKDSSLSMTAFKKLPSLSTTNKGRKGATEM